MWYLGGDLKIYSQYISMLKHYSRVYCTIISIRMSKIQCPSKNRKLSLDNLFQQIDRDSRRNKYDANDTVCKILENVIAKLSGCLKTAAMMLVYLG